MNYQADEETRMRDYKPWENVQFEVREYAALLGQTARRVQSWAEMEFVRPYVREAPGSRRKFSLGDIVRGAVLIRVQAVVGAKSPLGRSAVLAVHELAEECSEKLYLMEMPDRTTVLLEVDDSATVIAWWYSADTLAAALNRQSTVIVIDLYSVLDEVLPRLEELDSRRSRR
jgi:hypothetical protein